MRANLRTRRARDGPASAAAANTSEGRPLGNLFARLDDNTARKLSSLAQDRLEELEDLSRINPGSVLWTVSGAAFSTGVSSGVEFLPLRVEIRSDQTQKDDGDGAEEDAKVIYTSYNGGSVHLVPAGE